LWNQKIHLILSQCSTVCITTPERQSVDPIASIFNPVHVILLCFPHVTQVASSETLLVTLLQSLLDNFLSIITEITSPEIVDCMLRFSRSQNTRLKNLATIFLEDYCTPEQVAEAKKTELQPVNVANIPLPQN
jgi:hypothetical protein